MDEEFLINIVIAGKKYPLTIKRHEEELVRAAADQINSKILQYRQHFAVEVDTKDLLAMVAFQLSMHNLELENGMIQILLRIRYRSLQPSWKDI